MTAKKRSKAKAALGVRRIVGRGASRAATKKIAGKKATKRASSVKRANSVVREPEPVEVSGDGAALIVVESPAKAKTIGKYLGRGYRVKATIGHVRDLPAKKLGIDVEDGFKAEYITIPGKE